jgi:hypothetical protein
VSKYINFIINLKSNFFFEQAKIRYIDKTASLAQDVPEWTTRVYTKSQKRKTNPKQSM